MNTYYRGLFAEWLSRMYLRMHGFRIIHSRYITGRNTGRAEIDIIARRKTLLVFIEVKNHKTINSAWSAITDKQIKRLRRSGETYISRTRWHGDARFDVIIVNGWHIHWIKNAI
ncbi:MAG: YraN family protein [Alphaproteobacteria bacterium]|nr:YraN family protein [Alphaproteobacteria bacterium]